MSFSIYLPDIFRVALLQIESPSLYQFIFLIQCSSHSTYFKSRNLFVLTLTINFNEHIERLLTKRNWTDLFAITDYW